MCCTANIIATGFKGQLHIPLIVFILRAATHIVHHQEFKKGHVFIFFLMLGIMLKHQGKA